MLMAHSNELLNAFDFQEMPWGADASSNTRGQNFFLFMKQFQFKLLLDEVFSIVIKIKLSNYQRLQLSVILKRLRNSYAIN